MVIEYSEVRDILQPLCESLDGKSSMRRDGRDEWNSKVRKYLDQRNELNSRVKDLIANSLLGLDFGSPEGYQGKTSSETGGAKTARCPSAAEAGQTPFRQ